VSILIAVSITVGLLRGAQPASNVSMMTMRPPQHGQGWIGLSVASVLAGASSGFVDRGGCGGVASLISSRARSIVSALVRLLAKSP
jgi:hypothetical protein